MQHGQDQHALPACEGAYFDFDDDTQRHIPRPIEPSSGHPGFCAVSVEHGVGGAEPSSVPACVAALLFTFDRIDFFLACLHAPAEELRGDIPNCTDIVAHIQFDDIVIGLSMDT